MSTNEAAERLREFLAEISNDQPSDTLRDLADALAHEHAAGAAKVREYASAGAALLDEQAAERWLTANDLYAVTHIHVVESCAECRLSEGTDR